MSDQQLYASMDADDFSQGGGLFDDVDALVTVAEFTDQAPEGYNVEGDVALKFFRLGLRIDGADGDVEQSYPLGAKTSENHEIAEDGGALRPLVTGAKINGNSKFATFMSALKTAQFPVTKLGGPGGSIKNLVGLRAHFNRIADPERTGLQTGNKQKKYPQSTLCVSKVHSLPGQAADAKKGTKAAAAKNTAAPAPAAAVASAPSGADDLNALGEQTLMNVLMANDGKIEKQKLALAVVKELSDQPADKKNALGKLIFSEAFLDRANGWVFDKASKPQMVKLAA
jgi:hypothetical protein